MAPSPAATNSIPASVGAVERPGIATSGAPTVYQQRIAERLADIDPKLSRMYLGGLRVLRDTENPERIAQSAHSIRESTSHLSNLGKRLLTKADEEAAKSAETNNARQLERVFDPLGGVRYFERTLYDTWNKEFHQFFVDVSHHRREVTFAEYLGQLDKFEEFLNWYILPPQTEVYEIIDAYLREGPGGSQALDLELLLSRNLESYRYFFRNADGRWLGFLQQHHFLISNWEVAEYLARITPDAPTEVMTIIEQLPTRPEDWITRRAILDAAMKMPIDLGVRLIQKIEQEAWLEGPAGEWLWHQFKEFFARLVTGGAHQDALHLARVLLAPSKAHHYLHSYHYGEFLKEFSLVGADTLVPYLTLLANVLHTALIAEYPNTTKDNSILWRPAIEEHEQNWGHGELKDLLVIALRDGLERYAAHVIEENRPDWKRVIQTILSPEPCYAIFTRLQFHLYRRHPSEFPDEIEHVLFGCSDDATLWHEYSLLLQQAFPTLPRDLQEQYLALIDAGPSGDVPEYKEHWQVRRLALIHEHLEPTERTKRASLLAQVSKISYPDLLSVHFSYWGPTTPTTAAELVAMSIEALVEYLVTWAPGAGWRGPSREGLGRELSTAVGQSPTTFSHEALRFADTRLRPAYVYHFMFGLLTGARTKQDIEWEPVVDLMNIIISRAIAGDLPVFAADGDSMGWETNWKGVYQEIGSVLEAALHREIGGPSFTARERIWTCIAFLCEQPDPTPEHERQYGGKNMDPFTLSINTVRGTAFHALFAYIFWCDRHREVLGQPTERIAPEAKVILQQHLDSTHDSSLAIRSVYGRYFPWLYIFDPTRASERIAALFPADDVALRYAAWETYLANNVFDPVYKALRPQYEQAIRDLRTLDEDRRFWSDPVEQMGAHLMTAYVYRLEEEPNALWEKFFRVATPQQRGKAVGFCGHVYAERPVSAAMGEPPNTERLQQFWDWRLNESKDSDELRAFGCWAMSDKFHQKWLVEHLTATLKKTGGVVDQEFSVLTRLRTEATQYPVLCTNALELLVKAKSADRIMLGHNEEIREILTAAFGSTEPKAIAQAKRIIDYLTRLGFENYRSLETIEHPLPVSWPARALIARRDL